jgi:hypothetical protein
LKLLKPLNPAEWLGTSRPQQLPLPSAEHSNPTTFKALLKYIPTEVVAVFVLVDGMLRSAAPSLPIPVIRWVVFFALLAGTWLYLQRVERVSKLQQLLISTVAFAVWVFSLGGPFSAFTWYSPLYGAILLPLYTFSIPIFQAKK